MVPRVVGTGATAIHLMTSLSLTDLVGKHLLRGVDIAPVDPDKENDWVRFQLDDAVYEATSDGDGYRSYLNRLVRIDQPIVNAFRGVRVVASMSTVYDEEVLQLVNARSGAVILRVGTRDCSDYYPSWVATYHPKNLKA